MSCTDADFGESPRHPAIYFEWEDMKGKKRTEFNSHLALARLLMEEKVFVGREKLHVICNDVFAWGVSDLEELPLSELKNLYDMYHKDPEWGPEIWCIQRRKMMPQRPVEKAIRDAGIWDLDSMGLEPNTYDDYIKAKLAEMKKP